jgi:transposase InsO family protein
MAWQEASIMSLRDEFVALASREGANVRALCRHFAISPTTGYKWLNRYRAAGAAGLADRSRRPHTSPRQTTPDVEAEIMALRDAHPAWGGRKLRTGLGGGGGGGAGPPPPPPPPAASTVTAILRRHDRLEPAEATKHTAWQRFEHAAPNELWQMDFKGHFGLDPGPGRCYPLTVLDDHSRYALVVAACADERGTTVRAHLTTAFLRYGMPVRLLADNGPPWSASGQPWTPLTVWLLRLGIRVSHGRPAHPQTQGKDERFHRTLKAEALAGRSFPDLAAAQTRFDAFRDTYNLRRPHEALALATPSTRYDVSPRPFPETLPPIEYADGELVRTVQDKGTIWIKGRPYRVPEAFRGERVAVRPTTAATIWEVCFGSHPLGLLDLAAPAE